MIKVLHVNIQKNGYTNVSHATQANIQNIVVNTLSQQQKNRLSKSLYKMYMSHDISHNSRGNRLRDHHPNPQYLHQYLCNHRDHP
jgi:hypothetical protein